MPFDVNELTLIGRAGKDPVTNPTQSGKDIVTFSVATGHYLGKDDDGKPRIDTEWTDVKCFGYCAKDAQMVQKGDRVLVRGRKKTESWDDKDGNKQYRTYCYANSVEIILVPSKE